MAATDGYSYERSSIETWLSNHDTSPMTNLQMPNGPRGKPDKKLYPNRSLRQLISKFNAQRPERERRAQAIPCAALSNCCWLGPLPRLRTPFDSRLAAYFAGEGFGED